MMADPMGNRPRSKTEKVWSNRYATLVLFAIIGVLASILWLFGLASDAANDYVVSRVNRELKWNKVRLNNEDVAREILEMKINTLIKTLPKGIKKKYEESISSVITFHEWRVVE